MFTPCCICNIFIKSNKKLLFKKVYFLVLLIFYTLRRIFSFIYTLCMYV